MAAISAGPRTCVGIQSYTAAAESEVFIQTNPVCVSTCGLVVVNHMLACLTHAQKGQSM